MQVVEKVLRVANEALCVVARLIGGAWAAARSAGITPTGKTCICRCGCILPRFLVGLAGTATSGSAAAISSISCVCCTASRLARCGGAFWRANSSKASDDGVAHLLLHTLVQRFSLNMTRSKTALTSTTTRPVMPIPRSCCSILQPVPIWMPAALMPAPPIERKR